MTVTTDATNDLGGPGAAEEKLQEAQTRMRDLLEHSPAVLYALAFEGGTIVPRFVSQNVTRLLGFPSAETLTVEWWLAHLHPDDRENAQVGDPESLVDGVSRTEYRLRHHDGTYRWVDDHRRLVRDKEGRPAEIVGVWIDITDRKLAEEQSLESERRLHDMLNNLELVALMLDNDACITYCNNTFLELTGWRREEVIGRGFLTHFAPTEETEHLRKCFESLLENTPEAWHMTFEIVTRSGGRRLIRWNNSLLRRADGGVIGVATVGEDVTARLESERDLQRNEERLRIIIDASADAVWEWDIETGRGVWSDRAYEMLGLDRSVFRPNTKPFLAIVHPEDIAHFKQAIAEHIDREKPFQVRLRVRHGNGSFVPILVRGQLRQETAQMVGVFTDLSAVETATERIREQAALIDQARDAIVVRDLDDRITFFSKGAERLYEHRSPDVIGRPFDQLFQVESAQFAEAKQKVLSDGMWSGEVEKVTASGRTVVVDGSWTLLVDDHGRPRSIFSIDTDITERKRLEQQFFRGQRLESLGTLAGGIAHDLNNLLMPILMGVTLIKRTETGEQNLRAINNIETSVRRGVDLVKQILLFARGVEGTRSALSVAAIVEEVRVILESTFPRNVTFRTTLPPALPAVFGDATQLNQVVLNLCVNARDAMASGGELMITASEQIVDREHAVRAGGTSAGAYVVIEVADSGMGMTAQVMDRVFEPFFTTKKAGTGSGLGLSTARGIVRSHGGFIVVSSNAGKGSTFRVFLPAHRGPAHSEATGREVRDIVRGNGETILVVDDEAAILDVLRQSLVSFGYKVLTAATGAEALVIFQSRSAEIAAVVTDMMMPVMDGRALIASLRRLNPVLPIIAMSGHIDPSQIPDVGPAQATRFLTKPYTVGLMMNTLAEVLHDQSAAIR